MNKLILIGICIFLVFLVGCGEEEQALEEQCNKECPHQYFSLDKERGHNSTYLIDYKKNVHYASFVADNYYSLSYKESMSLNQSVDIICNLNKGYCKIIILDIECLDNNLWEDTSGCYTYLKIENAKSSVNNV